MESKIPAPTYVSTDLADIETLLMHFRIDMEEFELIMHEFNILPRFIGSKPLWSIREYQYWQDHMYQLADEHNRREAV